MTLKCPHCGEGNVVAGYYESPCRDGQRTEGEVDRRPRCGFCGKRFTPEQGKAVKGCAESGPVV